MASKRFMVLAVLALMAAAAEIAAHAVPVERILRADPIEGKVSAAKQPEGNIGYNIPHLC